MLPKVLIGKISNLNIGLALKYTPLKVIQKMNKFMMEEHIDTVQLISDNIINSFEYRKGKEVSQSFINENL